MASGAISGVLIVALFVGFPRGTASPFQEQQATPSSIEDVVATAALEHARDLEEELPGEARKIYDAVVQHYDSAWCSGGPILFGCGDEARRRLRVIDCRAGRGNPKPASNPDELAARLSTALAAGDSEALLAHATCDFLFGKCRSDVAVNDAPEPSIAILLRVCNDTTELRPSEVSDGWRTYATTSTPSLTLIFEENAPSRGWMWTALCFGSGELPVTP